MLSQSRQPGKTRFAKPIDTANLFNRARARARYRSRSLIMVSEKKRQNENEDEKRTSTIDPPDPTPSPSNNDKIRPLQLLDQFIMERPTEQPKSFFSRTTNHDVGNAVLLGKRN